MHKSATPRKAAIAPLVVTVPEAATALSVSRTVIYQLFNKRELPFVRIAGRTMVPVSALHAFVAATSKELRVRGRPRAAKAAVASESSPSDAAA